jgi:hypothetical protein
MGGRSLLHIPVAFGVGRSCPSQPHRRDRCAFCCKSLEPEAEGDSPPSWIGTSGSRRGVMRSTIYSGSSETRPRKRNAKDATIHFADGRRWGLRLVCVRGRPRVVTSTGHSSTNPAWLRSFLLCLVFWNTVIWKRGSGSRRSITLAATEQGDHHPQQSAGNGYDGFLFAAPLFEPFENPTPVPTQTHQPPGCLDECPTQ